jgi:hypothetical protein
MSAADGAGCRAQAEDWCGHGLCVDKVESASNNSQWRCVCDPGWASSVLATSLERCVTESAVVNFGIGFIAAASLFIIFLVAYNSKQGRLNRLRASFTMLACVINCGLFVYLMFANQTTIEDGRGRAATFFVLEALSLTLFGPCNSVVVVDRYLQATSATAIKLKAPVGQQLSRQGTINSRSTFAQVQELSSGTKHVMVFSIACWLLTCVFWACAGWDPKALLVGLLADMALVTSAALRHVLASTNELRRDIAFAESQVENPELLDKLRRLQRQIAKRRNAVVPPSLCTILTTVSILSTVLFSPLSQDVVDRVDYIGLLWIPTLLGDIYGRGLHLFCASREASPVPRSSVFRSVA